MGNMTLSLLVVLPPLYVSFCGLSGTFHKQWLYIDGINPYASCCQRNVSLMKPSKDLCLKKRKCSCLILNSKLPNEKNKICRFLCSKHQFSFRPLHAANRVNTAIVWAVGKFVIAWSIDIWAAFSYTVTWEAGAGQLWMTPHLFFCLGQRCPSLHPHTSLLQRGLCIVRVWLVSEQNRLEVNWILFKLLESIFVW